jgi:malic enzyme
MSDTIDPNSNTAKKEALRKAALDYHEYPTPGKISVNSTKSVVNQRDLALAYSPGVAFACEEIAADPTTAFRYTARGNLVGVVTNGTAVLGLGAIGPLAAKPVMEGKAVLFKKFAGIDVFDIEIAETDPDKLVEIIAALEPTFGGINLEDIKAPDCFVVERKLRERMKIPVFHDDQHGTAIVVGAGVINALKITGKAIDQVKVVTSGAGAAALACVDLLVELGVPERNIWLTDLAGVVYQGRVELMDPDKARFAQPTSSWGCRLPAWSSPRWWPGWRRIRSSSRLPIRTRKSCPRKSRRSATTRSWRPVAPTIRTRSTTSCAFRSSSVAHSTRVQRRSRARWKSLRSMRSPSWPSRRPATSSRKPTASRT